VTQPRTTREARELIARHVDAIRKLRVYIAQYDPRCEALSPAAARVFPYITTARTISEIARELAVTESAVKSSLTLIYRKLGVGNRARAILALLDEGATP
jgi:DNA-binding NarL/FixJ family response regulator